MENDYYNEDGVHNPPGWGGEETSRPRIMWLVIAGVILVSAVFGLYFLARGGDEQKPLDPSADETDFAPSFGVTQAQVDKLGDSIQARYESGDTEVAQALLDDFMAAHPECVSAVMAGGEGRMRAVLAESEQVAGYLKNTAPYPNVYTTVITVREKGVVRAAVLGVSCREETST